MEAVGLDPYGYAIRLRELICRCAQVFDFLVVLLDISANLSCGRGIGHNLGSSCKHLNIQPFWPAVEMHDHVGVVGNVFELFGIGLAIDYECFAIPHEPHRPYMSKAGRTDGSQPNHELGTKPLRGALAELAVPINHSSPLSHGTNRVQVI